MLNWFRGKLGMLRTILEILREKPQLRWRCPTGHSMESDTTRPTCSLCGRLMIEDRRSTVRS